MELPQNNVQSPFLAIPRELRDEIFSYLILPEHVFTSTSRPDAQSLHQSSKNPETFIDTRIYLPARAPSNVLSVCRQLREEFLHHVCRLANAPTLSSIPGTKPVEETQSNVLAGRANQSDEDTAERHQDNGTVRITMEIKRPMRGNMGFFTPARDTISPRIAAMAFLLQRLRRVKFVVWGGMAWWDGPPIVSRTSSGQRSVQSDEPQATQPVNGSNSIPTEHEAKPDPLLVSMDELLKLMPNVEEVDIDVLIHAREYLNWNLPDIKHEGIRGWIGSPISSLEGREFSRVDRRLIACLGPHESVVFYRRLEEKKSDPKAPDDNIVHISEGRNEITDEWRSLPINPPFTRVFESIQ